MWATFCDLILSFNLTNWLRRRKNPLTTNNICNMFGGEHKFSLSLELRSSVGVSAINLMNTNYNLHDINRHYQFRWANFVGWYLLLLTYVKSRAFVTNGLDKDATTHWRTGVPYHVFTNRWLWFRSMRIVNRRESLIACLSDDMRQYCGILPLFLVLIKEEKISS